MKKRLLSWLLVVCMLLTSMPIAFAADFATGDGEFGITIKEVIPTSTNTLKVTLTQESGATKEVPVVGATNVEDTTADTYSGKVSGIANGEYTLTVEGDNYATYTQKINIKDNCVNIMLYNEISVNYGRYDIVDGQFQPKTYTDAATNSEKTYVLFGVIAIGDVNGDGQITKDDADAVTAHIGETDEESIAKYDLNGDDKIDTVDLTYVTRNILSNKISSNIMATPVTSVSSLVLAKKANVAAAEGTKATAKAAKKDASGQVQKDENGNVVYEEKEADLKEVLLAADAETVVSLAPQDADAEISANSPAELDLDLGTAEAAPGEAPEDAPVVEAITIVPPVDSANKITEGTLTVEGFDTVEKKDVTVEAPLSDSAAPAKISTMSAKRSAKIMAIGAEPAPIAEPAKVDGKTAVESNGTIVVDLGGKVAIKKVSIRVTGTSSGKLADIAKVEFLDDFASRIPEPKLSIPEIIEGSVSNSEGEYKSLTFSWTKQENITGYEVSINGPGVPNITRTTDDTTFKFQSDKNVAVLQTYGKYEIKVRSFSGDWKSEWSQPYTHEVTCISRPNAPEYLKATPGIGFLNISWRALYDTNQWTLYYRNVTKGEQEYTATDRLNTASYKLDNLQGGDEYEFYVVGHNRIGDSPNSAHATGIVLTATGAQLPEYELINTNNYDGKALTHIKEIAFYKTATMTLYKKDAKNSVVALTDNQITKEDLTAILTDHDPETYFTINDWDSGNSYDGTGADHNDTLKAPIIRLDEKMTVDTFCIAPKDGATAHMNSAKIGYIDENGQKQLVGASLVRKYDDQGRTYYEIVAAVPITSDEFQIRVSGTHGMSASEIAVYNYVSAFNDAKALFTDSRQIELVDDADTAQQKVNAIRETINKPDAKGNYYPKKDATEIILQQAERLIKYRDLDEPIRIHTEITPKADGNMDSALPVSNNQPLGYVAAAGETVIIFVADDKGSADGTATNLYLVSTQYHSEVNKWNEMTKLHIGANEIVIPPITTATRERGGALYAAYEAGRATTNDYTVRVQGGTKIPMLDVSSYRLNSPEMKDKADKDALRQELIAQYIKDLEAYVGTDGSAIEALHDKLHHSDEQAENASVYYDYDAENCFLNSTEVVMDYAEFSVPATKALEGIKAGATAKRISNEAQLSDALEAMDQEIEFFYQFKGLYKTDDMNDTDRYPSGKQNIRYMTMFTGAFMYAAGEHIGIGYDSVPGIFATTPIKTDAQGKYESGGYSGWGIGHEIGHVINNKNYQVTEVTNNMFAQLAQIFDGVDTRADKDTPHTANDNFRSKYDGVGGTWSKVTGTNAGNVPGLGDSLAFFWQLHLAYDNDYHYVTYENHDEQLAHIFYARVDSYYRSVARFNNSEKGKTLTIPLNLSGDKVNNFMRVCVAAADKDCLDFFRAWGMTPDEETVAFAAQFEPETRKIQYVDDNSFYYAIENKESVAANTTVNAQINGVDGTKKLNSNKVEITITNTAEDQSKMLGYEIHRDDKIVAFVPVDASGTTVYTDVVATENNKAFVYKVVGVDHMLNATKEYVLPEVKVMHDGAIDKTDWTILDTTLYSEDDVTLKAGDETKDQYSCEDVRIPNLGKIYDNDNESVYKGTSNYELDGVQKTGVPMFTIDFGKVEQVTAIKFVPSEEEDALKAFQVYVSTDGENWGEMVKEINSLQDEGVKDNQDGSYTAYFNKAGDKYMYTYDARYLMVIAKDITATSISLAELDVLGPTNDNIELEHTGYLAEEYTYNTAKQYKIPQNAVMFYGTFKGDPAYSVVLLRDANDNIISGDQIVLAPVTEDGDLGETSDGAWIYWLVDPFTEEVVTKDNLQQFIQDYKDKSEGNIELDFSSVQAELYRVQNATTMEGQRLTSNTLHVALNENTPIQLASDPTVSKAQGEYNQNPPTLAGTEPVALASNKLFKLGTPIAKIANGVPVAMDLEEAEDENVVVTETPSAVSIVVNDEDANAEEGFARFRLNTTTNPYAVHFTVKLDLQGTGNVANAKIKNVTFPTADNDASVYLGYKIAADGQSVDVYAATMSTGIQNPIVGDVAIDDAPLAADTHQGHQHLYYSIDGFEKLNSAYTLDTMSGEEFSAKDFAEYECKNHEYDEVAGSATCTEPGSVAYTCKFCGNGYTEYNADPLGHDFEDWKVTTEPTCTEDGVEERHCTRCDEVEKQAVPAIGHTDKNTDGKCDNCGEDYEFKCSLCDKYEQMKDIPVIGPIFGIIHSIVHLFARIGYYLGLK